MRGATIEPRAKARKSSRDYPVQCPTMAIADVNPAGQLQPAGAAGGWCLRGASIHTEKRVQIGGLWAAPWSLHVSLPRVPV